MASEGESGDAAETSALTVSVATADPDSLEKYPAGGNQGHAHQYYPLPAGSTPVSCPLHEAGNSNAGDRTLQNVSYQYNLQRPETVQDVSSASTSTAAVADVYSGYSYSTSTSQYGYGGSEYTNYYSNYQQQPNQSYQQPSGAYQNSDSWSLHRKQLRLESRKLYRLLPTLYELWPRHKQCLQFE